MAILCFEWITTVIKYKLITRNRLWNTGAVTQVTQESLQNSSLGKSLYLLELKKNKSTVRFFGVCAFVSLYSDADLNSSRTKFKRRKMLISVKLLTKYVMIIYLCIRFRTWKVRRLNQSRSKVAPKVKFPAGLGEQNGWAVPNWNKHSYYL